MLKRIVVVIFAVVFMAGCSSDSDNPKDEPSQSNSPRGGYGYSADDAFVKVVTDRSPQLAGVPDAKLIGIAKDLCGAFRRVAPVDEQEFVTAVQSFANGTGGIMKPMETAYFMGAAAAAYCPDISDDISGLTQSAT